MHSVLTPAAAAPAPAPAGPAHDPSRPAAPRGARVLADVGGTNARFAWQAHPGAALEDEQTLPCDGHPSLASALQAWLAGAGRAVPAEACIAIANPVCGDRVVMTNHHWSFSIEALRAALGLHRLRVINDFTALALALPGLHADERRQLGGRAARPDAAMALIGPGTGLGVSGLLPDGRGAWVPLQGEGGHATLAATTPREQAVLALLARRHGHVSAERAVSGPGLVDLHRAVCALAQAPAPEHSAADITERALAGIDAACEEALMLFCGFLGCAAGNLALTLGAQGGVFLGGGIVPRLGPALERSPLRERFERKGRFQAYLADIPLYVITATGAPALRGAAATLDQGLAVGWEARAEAGVPAAAALKAPA